MQAQAHIQKVAQEESRLRVFGALLDKFVHLDTWEFRQDISFF
jgi:hypothetical protein